MRYAMYPDSNAAHERGVAVVPLEPYPAPEHGSDMPDAPGPPLPVAQVTALGARHGWPARWTYARGHVPHGTHGRPLALSESYAVRFGRHPVSGRSAVAVYRSPAKKGDWSWKSIWVWGPDLPWFSHFDLAGLKFFVKMKGIVDLQSLEAIRESKRKAQE